MVLDDIHKLWVNRGYDKAANLAAWYINRLKNRMHVDVETEKAAEAYLREIAIEGKVYETISTTIATIGWRNTLETE